jgi:hypothetical protein
MDGPIKQSARHFSATSAKSAIPLIQIQHLYLGAREKTCSSKTQLSFEGENAEKSLKNFKEASRGRGNN